MNGFVGLVVDAVVGAIAAAVDDVGVVGAAAAAGLDAVGLILGVNLMTRFDLNRKLERKN